MPVWWNLFGSFMNIYQVRLDIRDCAEQSVETGRVQHDPCEQPAWLR